MTAAPVHLDGLQIIEPRLFADDRGVFFESYNAAKFAEIGGPGHAFVQDNQSVSHAGVLRGLHYQAAPAAQGKLVRVLRGEIFDVAVDIRPNSSTFGQWEGFVLTAENHRQLWIPAGFAHGFLALSDCEVLYKTDAYYAPALEHSIRWDDPEIGIAWPLVGPPILSPKDAAAAPLWQSLAVASAASRSQAL